MEWPSTRRRRRSIARDDYANSNEQMRRDNDAGGGCCDDGEGETLCAGLSLADPATGGGQRQGRQQSMRASIMQHPPA